MGFVEQLAAGAKIWSVHIFPVMISTLRDRVGLPYLSKRATRLTQHFYPVQISLCFQFEPNLRGKPKRKWACLGEGGTKEVQQQSINTDKLGSSLDWFCVSHHRDFQTPSHSTLNMSSLLPCSLALR